MERGGAGKGQLLFALAILLAFAGALWLAPSGSNEQIAAGEPRGGADGRSEPDLSELSIALEPQVARRVEKLRGLEFDQVPEPEVVDSDYLNRLGERELEHADGRKGLGADEAELRILGLLGPEEDLDSLFGSTGDLAAAAYDPRTDRLYVVSDSVGADRALVEFVLAHELQHALEDQRFGLGGGADLDDDAALAEQALVEGSATAMMIDYASRFIGAGDLLGATAALGADDGGLPDFYLDQVTWTYMGGARFVGALRELGGGWKLVDHALSTRPPATTEQVLHVDKYVRDEPALPVTLAADTLRADGWRRADAGVVGELTTSQLLEVGVETPTAEQAAAGWGGDRYELWRQDAPPAGCEHPCREDFVLALGWRMDSEAEGVELARGLGAYLKDGLGGRSEGSGVWRLDRGFAALGSSGDAAVLVFAPDAETAAAVVADQR